METHSKSDRSYDVAIIGGALAGSATAILLLRQHPKLRILIIEKSSAFTRRVGEATVEVSSYFLSRVLGLTQYLNEAHLMKQGMRFWFHNDQARTLEDCSEIGSRYCVRLAAYQVDRSTLDEEILRRAKEMGAELLRPASVQKVELNAGGQQKLHVKFDEQTFTISARWAVDGSGVAALLARQNGWLKPNTEHPTTAVWARWRNVKDWDGYELAQKFPMWAKECSGIRGTATNHFTGYGWWAWCIPLKGGDVSVGVVYDQRLVEFPEGGSLGERLKTFMSQHPVAKEILADAQWIEGDVHWRKNLPYCTTTYAGDGFALVGDASAFIDPFYSPGMDWVSFTTTATAELISAHFRGEATAPLIEKHNRDFVRSYRCWFEALYKDKYFYMSDYDLMRLAFLLDVGLYYFGVASQPFKRGAMALKEPVFSTKPSVPFYHFISFYNRRLARIAQARRERNVHGKNNVGHRFMFGGYTFEPSTGKHLLKGILQWWWLELTEGWRSWGKPVKAATVEIPAKSMVAATMPSESEVASSR